MYNYHVITQSRVRAPIATEPRQRVEHARAREADEGNHDELEPWRRIPRDDEIPDPAFAIHPAIWAIYGDGVKVDLMVGSDIVGLLSFVVFLGVRHRGSGLSSVVGV